MERLADLNLAERNPHVLKELVLYSHPSVDRRIARARSARMVRELTVSIAPAGARRQSPRPKYCNGESPLALWHWTCYP